MGWSTNERVEAIAQRTARGGTEVIELLGTGSAFYAPAAAAVAMAEAFLRDSRRVLPCSAKLNGPYGVQGVFVGVRNINLLLMQD